MQVHSSILDTILNTSNQASYHGSADLGDAFMDSNHKAAGRGRLATKTASVMGSDNELTEAVSGMGRHMAKTAAATPKLKSIQSAIEFVASLETKFGTKNAGKQAWKDLTAAAGRLNRLASKTASQMKQDGASKLADYFNPAVVPAWAKQASEDFSLIQNVYGQMRTPKNFKSAALISSDADVIKERGVSDAEIQGYVKKWLNEGVSPAAVKEKLNKLADIQLFDKSMASEYLNNHAGVLGYAYIEPNHYQNDCASTADRLNVKMGGTKAASVMQIAACTGCQHFSKSANSKRCNLYRLPIVANQKELFPIINNLVPGAKNKKSALVSKANGEHKKVASAEKSAYGRNTVKGSYLVNKEGSDKQVHTAAARFTEQAVLAMHNAGQPMKDIYAHGTKIAGVVRTKKAMRAFIAGLKDSKTKIALSQIDCTFLVGKLGASNAIYGEKKCASCTYRSGMHCGLTGGTLVSFPGMKSASKTASATTGGLQYVSEFGLETPKLVDIKLNAPHPEVGF